MKMDSVEALSSYYFIQPHMTVVLTSIHCKKVAS